MNVMVPVQTAPILAFECSLQPPTSECCDDRLNPPTAQPVLAGKACASKANRAALKGQHRDGIMRKAARNRPLRQSEKRFNKQISKRRFRVEQCLGTMKGPFGLHRARCFGVARTHAQMVMAAISRNLLKAANRITLIQKTPPIAQTGNAEQIRLKQETETKPKPKTQ